LARTGVQLQPAPVLVAAKVTGHGYAWQATADAKSYLIGVAQTGVAGESPVV